MVNVQRYIIIEHEKTKERRKLVRKMKGQGGKRHNMFRVAKTKLSNFFKKKA